MSRSLHELDRGLQSPLRRLGEQHGARVVATPDTGGRVLSIDPMEDAYRVRLALPSQYGVLRIAQSTMEDAATSELFDVIDTEFAACAANMRGEAIRSMLDSGRPIRFVSETDRQARYEQAERIGLALIQQGERLIDQARRLKP